MGTALYMAATAPDGDNGDTKGCLTYCQSLFGLLSEDRGHIFSHFECFSSQHLTASVGTFFAPYNFKLSKVGCSALQCMILDSVSIGFRMSFYDLPFDRQDDFWTLLPKAHCLNDPLQ